MPARLLFLHTGGTLGMTPLTAGGALAPDHFERSVLPYIRGVEEIASIESRALCNIDSSDMTPAHWEMIGREIAGSVNDFDGFVVLHGTDTMAWTACALSFMLRDLPRPVILTGSQRPLSALRTDARSNLVHSAICATMDLPEVGLYFGSHLFRGNRATKVSIQEYEAFASPNYPPLLTMGVDVERGPAPLRPRAAFRFKPGFSEDVAVQDLIPGASPRTLLTLVDAGCRVLILRAFGDGNLPKDTWPAVIAQVVARGAQVVVASQCRAGCIQPGRYEGSSQARDAGALFGDDMTSEAAAVKAMWLLGQGVEGESFRASFNLPVAGECL